MSKVVLFDLGNVLAKPIDNKKLYYKLKTNISYEEFEEYWFYNETVIKAHEGKVDDDIHIKELLEFCKSPLSITDFYNIYFNMENTLYESTVELIRKLKNNNIKIGLLSNLRLMDYKRYENKLNELKFDYLFLSYEMKCIKPSKNIYDMVIKKCNCNADDIIFFDDNNKNVESAKECGINAFQTTGDTIIDVLKKIILY